MGADVKSGSNAVSEITDRLIFDLIKQHYRPYDMHEEFNRSFSAYQTGNFSNPHESDRHCCSGMEPGGRGCNTLQESDCGVR